MGLEGLSPVSPSHCVLMGRSSISTTGSLNNPTCSSIGTCSGVVPVLGRGCIEVTFVEGLLKLYINCLFRTEMPGLYIAYGLPSWVAVKRRPTVHAQYIYMAALSVKQNCTNGTIISNCMYLRLVLYIFFIIVSFTFL